MSIANDPEMYKLLLGVVMGMFGLLNGAGLFVLNGLKKADDELFLRMRELEKEHNELKGEHNAHHGRK